MQFKWLQQTKFAFYTLFFTISYQGICNAQIVPDNTLPTQSTVRLQDNTQFIEGGTRAGNNLFHSFTKFSVPDNSTVFFNNPADVQNILTRVTGSTRSDINGVIRANSFANLFLINPNGIIFGSNARLDIGGSFIGSTANAIVFGKSANFSATNPEAPSPLLTINPSALLFNQIQRNSIESNSVASDGRNPSNEFEARGLRVEDGKSLLLVGGDVSVNGGGLYAFGGRVELGGLAGVGTVGLNGDGNNLSLSFPNSVERSDVFLSNRARVNVAAGDGGSIAVNARNLEMTGESQLSAGIERGLGSGNSKAGNISVNATVAINLNNESKIANQLQSEANGEAGDVNISASTLRLEGGARIDASTYGAGKGGNLSVDAQDVQLIGTIADEGFSSGLYSQANSSLPGNAGNLTVRANTLLVRDGAQVSASTNGAGNGGSLSVDAQNVQIIGRSRNGRIPSALGASAGQNSTGNAGDFTIKTNTLIVRDGANVNTTTSGTGKGGNLSVDAQNVQITGISTNGRASRLGASAQRNSTGNAGDLTIKTNTLLMQDGAQVGAGTFGAGKGGSLRVDAQDVQIIGRNSGLFVSADTNSTGNAGDLTVKTNTLLVRDGAQVSAGTFGVGKGGSLRVDTQDVQIIGGESGLFTSTVNSTGNAGDLTIKTNTLLVRDGAVIRTGTLGAGKGGSLRVDAQDVQIISTGTDPQFPSGLFASANQNSTGNAGDLTVRTNTLLMRDGAVIFTGTYGAGKGGILTVDAQDVQLIGRSVLGAFTQPNSTGDAGDLMVRTDTLLVRDGAVVTVQSSGTGRAGNMTLNARSIGLNDNAFLSASTQSAKVDPNRQQATININSQDLILRRGSSITTNARGSEVIGGNININTDVLGVLQNSNITANSFNSRGGNIDIKTQGLFRSLDSSITATGATSELGGNINITTLADPSKDLVPLTVDFVDVARLVDDNICVRTANSSFTVIGRGGIPSSPDNPAVSNFSWEDWRLLEVSKQQQRGITVRNTPILNTSLSISNQIVEAQGWVIDKDGNVILTAAYPVSLPQNVLSPCQ